MKPYAQVDSYRVDIYVKTAHLHRLEFVCSDATERNNKLDETGYNNFYLDELDKMVQVEARKLGEGYGWVESCRYGDVSFWLESPTLEGIPKLVEAADRAIRKWANKYKVEGFRETDKQA
jgi:hypothetical protein